MEYVRLGSTGLRVSQVALGTMGYGDPAWRDWVLPRDEAAPVIKRALEHGINFYDLADFYSLGANEEVVASTLLNLTARDNLVLASKVYYAMSDDPNDQGLSRKHIMASIDRSLRRAKTDHLDLYIVHAFDPHTPMEETMEALNDVVRAGKARYLGASTMYAWQFAKMNAIAEKNGWARFVSMQCQYSLLYREEEREMVPYCRSEGIAVTTFSPLARGMLAGANDTRMKSDTFTTQMFGDAIDQAITGRVRELAQKRGLSMAEIAMAWVAASPHTDIPLIGAQTIEQLDTAIAAQSIALSQEEIAWLEEPYRPRDMINDHNLVYRPRASIA